MKRILVLLVATTSLSGAIRVSPTVVDVNAQGASTVFLSYGSLRPDQFSEEALWCADVVPATPPDIGMQCDPAKTWGRLPLRNDLARRSANSGFTDIMTIPQNVTRRAYQRAESEGDSSFYYVRRFGSSNGAPDEFIAIVCRLGGRGVQSTLALTDVKLAFATNHNVLATPTGHAPPPLHADLTYTGTGRLIGRWEIVVPGDEPPSPEDLVSEGSLPLEERGRQRRYAPLSRFNVFLPPVGQHRLEGPDVTKLPVAIDGLYQVLLRIEASDDGEGTTELAEVGAGSGRVTSGGVAGFPIPPLRYYVGSANADGTSGTRRVELVAPQAESVVAPGAAIRFLWRPFPNAVYYRLDLDNAQGATVLSAIVTSPATEWTAPPLTGERSASGRLTWRVHALDAQGQELSRSSTGTFRHGDAGPTQPQ
jgi:hypothetical protein